MNRFLLFCFFLMSGAAVAQKAPEGLFIASRAPDFRATDQQGQEWRLKELLKKGKVVLVFYRGHWCPYCNRFLMRLQDSLSLIRQKGAVLLAVTPESKEGMAKTVEQTKAAFPLLVDSARKIMDAYDVAYTLSENTVTRYRNSNIDILKINGSSGNWLPVPAVYVIDREATIRYRFFETDYRKRPSVREILEQL
jgi:peroxiredoxin